MKCPECGTELELALVPARGRETGVANLEKPSAPAAERRKTFTIGGPNYTLSDKDIVEAAASLETPGAILKYYVELPDSKWVVVQFPIKEVVRKALNMRYPKGFREDRFTAHRARDILTGLGFTVKTRY